MGFAVGFHPSLLALLTGDGEQHLGLTRDTLASSLCRSWCTLFLSDAAAQRRFKTDQWKFAQPSSLAAV
jgi:hypothetical protein